MTPKERAAMQQALEAIGDCSPNKALVNAAYALREALAEQAECKECGAKQAQIDRLMLEYCPDEMTPEQMQEWGNNQRPVEQAEQEHLLWGDDKFAPHERPQKQEPVIRATLAPPAPPEVYQMRSKDAYEAGWWEAQRQKAVSPIAPAQQAEQEPVAEILVNDDDVIVLWHKTARQLGHKAKLYAAPVRTKDLTNEDKLALWNKWNMTAAQIDAVIAAYKARNK